MPGAYVRRGGYRPPPPESPGDAPALFIAGQSNAGNVDTVPGNTDPRVIFTWTVAPGTVFTGPGAMALQNSGGNNGHSYEWQCSADMAAHYNASILVGKTWGDGGTCDQFIRALGATYWTPLRNMIDNFARQCNAAGKTQVAFIWDQGSSEALLVNAALTPQLTANTTALFASIRALFKAYGIGKVRFYVMQQNIHFQGQTGIDNTQLDSVRTQEAAIVAGDADAVLINCDDITQASGYHYAAGQTNTIGARFAALIAADFTGAQPSAVTPPTWEETFGANIVSHLRSTPDSVIGVTAGNPITTWTDLSGNGKDGTASSTARPLLEANALGTTPGVTYDGVNDKSAVALGRPAPGTSPTWTWEIMRPNGYSLGGRLWGAAAAAAPAVLLWSVSPNVQMYNGSFSGSAVAVVDQFNRVESYMSNSNAAHTETAAGVGGGDYLKVRESTVWGANVGNGAIGNVDIAHGNGSFTAGTWLDRVTMNIRPDKAGYDFICGYYTARYGTSVGIT